MYAHLSWFIVSLDLNRNLSIIAVYYLARTTAFSHTRPSARPFLLLNVRYIDGTYCTVKEQYACTGRLCITISNKPGTTFKYLVISTISRSGVRTRPRTTAYPATIIIISYLVCSRSLTSSTGSDKCKFPPKNHFSWFYETLSNFHRLLIHNHQRHWSKFVSWASSMRMWSIVLSSL